MKHELFIYCMISLISASPNHTFVNITEKVPSVPLDEQQDTISLINYVQNATKVQAFIQRSFIFAKTKDKLTIIDIPIDVSFIIVQIHTFQYNVSISLDENYVQPLKAIVSGTNIGLFVDVSEKNSTEVYVKNPNIKKVEALFVVVAYTRDAPVPGGCNMEFDLEISPFQKLTTTEAMIIVDSQPSSVPKNIKANCGNNSVHHDSYRLYLSAQDFTPDSYFSAIQKMLTPEEIMKNAQKIPAFSIGSLMRRVYSAYAGIGSVYAMVATYEDQSAAYVPTFSYACKTTSIETDGCSMLPNNLSKTLCLITLFLGIYLVFLGNKYPGTGIFIITFLGGGLIGYICLTYVGTLSPTDTLWATIGSALTISCICQFFKLCCGGTLTFFAALITAFFCSCITYYKFQDRVLPFDNNLYFWGVFCAFTLTMLIMILFTFVFSNIICCAMLGSYLLIVALDYYIGSSLKYIVINIIRRITVPGFEAAIIDSPYGSKEATLTAFWVIFALISFIRPLRCICKRRNYDSMTIPFATMDENGSYNVNPWRNIYRTHRELSRSVRNSNRKDYGRYNIF